MDGQGHGEGDSARGSVGNGPFPDLNVSTTHAGTHARTHAHAAAARKADGPDGPGASPAGHSQRTLFCTCRRVFTSCVG